MRGGLAGRVIRVCSGQQRAGSTKTAGRQRTGECKCKNRHVGNQGDSWATHWQRSTAAAWRESHQDTESSSAQAPFELYFRHTGRDRNQEICARPATGCPAVCTPVRRAGDSRPKRLQSRDVCTSILPSATPGHFRSVNRFPFCSNEIGKQRLAAIEKPQRKEKKFRKQLMPPPPPPQR